MDNLPDDCPSNHPNFDENPGCSRCEFSCAAWDDDRLIWLSGDSAEVVCENCFSPLDDIEIQ